MQISAEHNRGETRWKQGLVRSLFVLFRVQHLGERSWRAARGPRSRTWDANWTRLIHENQITRRLSGVSTTKPLYHDIRRKYDPLGSLVLDLHRLGALDVDEVSQSFVSLTRNLKTWITIAITEKSWDDVCLIEVGILSIILFLEWPVDLKMQRYV